MKRFKLFITAFIACLSVVTGVTGVLGFKTALAETEQAQMRLNLGESIAVIAECNVGEADYAKATFSWSGKADYEDVVEGVLNENGTYEFTYDGLSLQYADKTVNVNFEYSKNGSVNNFEKSFSIEEYLLKLKDLSADQHSTGYNEYERLRLRELANDMLVLAGAAQEYNGGAISPSFENASGTYLDSAELQPVANAVSGSGVTGWKTGVRYDYDVRPLASFALAANVSADLLRVEFFVGEESKGYLPLSSENGRYKTYYEGFSLLDYDKEYTFKVTAGETELGSLTYSLATLCYAKKDVDDVNARLVRSTYAYAKAAAQYKQSATAVRKQDYAVIEAEACSYTGGSLANSGMVAGYASDSKFLRNFTEGGTITLSYNAQAAYSSAEVYAVASSGQNLRNSGGVPLEVGEMKAAEMFTLTVNETRVPVLSTAVFEGKASETATWDLFGNFTAAKLCTTQLVRGSNVIKLTFLANVYKNGDGSDASANFDQFVIVLKGKEETKLPVISAGDKVEMESFDFEQGTDAVRTGTGDGYASSGQSSKYSGLAFVKNVASGANLSYTFTVNADCTLKLKMSASVTGTANNGFALSTAFKLYLNSTEISLDGVTMPTFNEFYPSEFELCTLELKAGESYTLLFEGVNAQTDERAFYDYVLFAANS